MPEKYRIAMIGAGGRATSVHYPSFHGLPDVEIAGICDIDPERLNKAADQYGVPPERRYGANVNSYRDMLNESRPDGVACIGQPHIMYDLWMWCLEHDFDLYIEKPMGLTLHQARSLNEMARRRNLVTTVSFQRRTTPLVMKLREMCLQRGPITHALVRFYKCDRAEMFIARDHMMDDTVHTIDTLRWACGGEVEKVESMTRRVGTQDINFISATLHFDNGAMGYFINSWSSGRRVFDIEMHAPGVCAEAEHEIGGTFYADGDTKGTYFSAAECAGSDQFHAITGVELLARDFVDCSRARRETLSSFASAYKTMEVAEMILAQSTLARR